MGAFSGVEKAKFNPGGTYFMYNTITVDGKEKHVPAHYVVVVDVAKLISQRNKPGAFVVETTVLYSEVAERKPGTTCSWFVDQSWDTFLGNCKHFAAVAMDVEETEVDEAGLEMIVSTENPIQGTVLALTATHTKTKKDADFSKVVWRQPSDEDLARVTADCAKRGVKVPPQIEALIAARAATEKKAG